MHNKEKENVLGDDPKDLNSITAQQVKKMLSDNIKVKDKNNRKWHNAKILVKLNLKEIYISRQDHKLVGNRGSESPTKCQFYGKWDHQQSQNKKDGFTWLL